MEPFLLEQLFFMAKMHSTAVSSREMAVTCTCKVWDTTDHGKVLHTATIKRLGITNCHYITEIFLKQH